MDKFWPKLFGQDGKIWSNTLTPHMQKSQNFEHSIQKRPKIL